MIIMECFEFVYQTCDFRLLNSVFYVLCFGFCVSCV